MDENTLKSQTRQLVRKFRAAYAFKFHEHKIFTCHGGISYLPNITTISTDQLIRGVGKYEDQIDQAWEESYQKNKTQGFTQVHGHRNTKSTEHSICLENGVEFGGDLMILTLTAKESKTSSFKNDVFKLPNQEDSLLSRKPWIEDTQNETTNKMIHNKFVKAKYLPNNLMSLNFTRKAYEKELGSQAL